MALRTFKLSVSSVGDKTQLEWQKALGQKQGQLAPAVSRPKPDCCQLQLTTTDHRPRILDEHTQQSAATPIRMFRIHIQIARDIYYGLRSCLRANGRSV